jgi:MoaA/NifB/PqqE/SkfB family radical SAM enzyme
MIMIFPHDKFCVLPWVSLETSPIGTVRPCCLAEHEIVDNGGEKFNLATATFAKIQNSHDMRRLRQQFIDKKQPETCKKCWNEERAGRTSKRMHTLDRLKHSIPPQDWTLDAKPLMFLDLKLGNICNLKCRICGSWSSSTFATEELKHVSNRKDSFHYQMLRDGAWPKENKLFWNEIEQVSAQLKYIEFTGGEPFMIREHFDMLQGLVVRGLAHNIEIHYNTNGTHWPEDAIEIWRHFKTVEVAFSIDDVAARFEYQRSNAKWDQVQENIAKFKNLQLRYPNIQLQVCSTVNVFNVYYIEELAHWIDKQEFNFVYWNMMHEAPYFSIANLPTSAKKAITDKLLTAHVSSKNKQEFKKIVDFMHNGTQDMSELMLEKMRELDSRRNENLAQVEPEFAKLIGYEATT